MPFSNLKKQLFAILFALAYPSSLYHICINHEVPILNSILYMVKNLLCGELPYQISSGASISRMIFLWVGSSISLNLRFSEKVFLQNTVEIVFENTIRSCNPIQFKQTVQLEWPTTSSVWFIYLFILVTKFTFLHHNIASKLYLHYFPPHYDAALLCRDHGVPRGIILQKNIFSPKPSIPITTLFLICPPSFCWFLWVYLNGSVP